MASSMAIPGSPFMLNVVPGLAHPLSTSIAAGLPLCGYLKGGESTAASFTLTLLTRDKTGNACVTGGANVTCGCVRGAATGLSERKSAAFDSEELDYAKGVTSKVTDKEDGTFELEWWAPSVGQFEVFVKMDGLHVIGSPAVMSIFKDESAWKRHDPAQGGRSGKSGGRSCGGGGEGQAGGGGRSGGRGGDGGDHACNAV